MKKNVVFLIAGTRFFHSQTIYYRSQRYFGKRLWQLTIGKQRP
jgi:hypothetical protein